jgi:hypothetical protein
MKEMPAVNTGTFFLPHTQRVFLLYLKPEKSFGPWMETFYFLHLHVGSVYTFPLAIMTRNYYLYLSLPHTPPYCYSPFSLVSTFL